MLAFVIIIIVLGLCGRLVLMSLVFVSFVGAVNCCLSACSCFVSYVVLVCSSLFVGGQSPHNVLLSI